MTNSNSKLRLFILAGILLNETQDDLLKLGKNANKFDTLFSNLLLKKYGLVSVLEGESNAKVQETLVSTVQKEIENQTKNLLDLGNEMRAEIGEEDPLLEQEQLNADIEQKKLEDLEIALLEAKARVKASKEKIKGMKSGDEESKSAIAAFDKFLVTKVASNISLFNLPKEEKSSTKTVKELVMDFFNIKKDKVDGSGPSPFFVYGKAGTKASTYALGYSIALAIFGGNSKMAKAAVCLVKEDGTLFFGEEEAPKTWNSSVNCFQINLATGYAIRQKKGQTSFIANGEVVNHGSPMILNTVPMIGSRFSTKEITKFVENHYPTQEELDMLQVQDLPFDMAQEVSDYPSVGVTQEVAEDEVKEAVELADSSLSDEFDLDLVEDPRFDEDEEELEDEEEDMTVYNNDDLPF